MIVYSHEEQDSPISTPLVVSPMLKTVEQMSKISGIGENKLRELMWDFSSKAICAEKGTGI